MVNIADLERRMEGAIGSFKNDLSGLRTGRASASLVENIQVEVYGSFMPLSQVATINVPENRLITLSVWDKENVTAVEKAITTADLGLNPAADGTLVRLPLPDLTEERRKELAKIAAKYAEQARIAVRNVRKSGNDDAKKEEKDGDLSQDEARAEMDSIQEMTDNSIKEIDTLLVDKEKDIMTV